MKERKEGKMPKLRDREKLMRAIGDPHRIRLITALMNKPQYVSQLIKTAKLDRSAASYNLAVLESTGILQSHYVILNEPHSKGRAARVYSVNTARLREALSLLDPLRSPPKVRTP